MNSTKGIPTRSGPPGGTQPAGATDDRALVARMGAGDEWALGALYDRWAPAVFALACRVLEDRDEAEDVVEDTFWQLWRQAASFDASRGGVSTWILMIARARALDRRRGISRRRTESLQDEAVIGRVGASTDDAAAAAEINDR